MERIGQPIVKDLVFVGGGHSHAIALRMFGMSPLPGVRLTLLTEASDTPYSGMLPGYVAGFYRYEECHIDLRPLAQFAQAQLYLDRVIGLDLENQRVICETRPPVGFNVLSIDIGSTPKLPDIPGIEEFVVPAKPVRRFLQAWQRLCDRLTTSPETHLTIGIVGGGTGGVELAFNMQRRLHEILIASGQPKENLEIHLFHRNAELMPAHNAWVRHHMAQQLHDRGIHLHLNEPVQAVHQSKIVGESGLTIGCDYIFWVTQASAPPWLRESGLTVNTDGFIQVQDTLQSISHPQIFAAGDIATMVNYTRPKAGVFAVRQGKPLFKNLQRFLQNQPLQPYKPQKDYLSLIGMGDRSAVASRGALGWHSPLLWLWKDRIDRQFMEKFSNLPTMQPEVQKYDNSPPPVMPCAGCGSKVGRSSLEHVLTRVQQDQPAIVREDVLIGLDAPDDAAVVRVPTGKVMVQTVDYFRSPIHDPYIFGQISANHCLSDLFAMGATPQSALAIVTLPYGTTSSQEETLYQLLSGALKILHQSNAALVGGHTNEGTDLAFGLSCNGLADPDRLLRKSGMQPGQVLILTKAIGTGTLFAAAMQNRAQGKWIDRAIASMLQSNQAAAACFLEHEATACTDVTGFGLIGHLLEMLQSSNVSAELFLDAIPILAGAQDTAQQGILSSLHPQNLSAARSITHIDEIKNHLHYPLLFDPQTSGGLLAALPAHQAQACLNALEAAGYTHSTVIGKIYPATEAGKAITIA
jgi:selenide, water dikinase